MKQIILANLSDFQSVVDEERYNFSRHILNEIGLPIDCMPEDPAEFDRDNKIAYRGLLVQYNVKAIEDRDGGLKIYHENDLLGEWKKPFYIRRVDRNQLDPTDRIYLEIHLEFYSVFIEE